MICLARPTEDYLHLCVSIWSARDGRQLRTARLSSPEQNSSDTKIIRNGVVSGSLCRAFMATHEEHD